MKSIFEKEFKHKHFRVTIFGSARIKKGDKTYKMVNELAKMIGEEGLDIVTGGGPGLMEAATSGHAKGRGKKKSRSLGLLIKLFNEQKLNKHLDIKHEFRHFSERLDNFMVLSNAVIVAPGGLGTMLELFYTWQLIQVKQICDIPIILLGNEWTKLIKWIRNSPLKNKYISEDDFRSIFIAKTNKEAIKIIKEAHEHYKRGNNVCLNIKKYRL